MHGLAHHVQNNSWVVWRDKSKFSVPGKESRSKEVSSLFQALKGPLLTATPVTQYSHFKYLPLTLLQITLTLKYSPSGRVTNNLQKEEFLVFHLSHQDK